eukprot:2670165-Pyramimonas_sp.AAC.1
MSVLAMLSLWRSSCETLELEGRVADGVGEREATTRPRESDDSAFCKKESDNSARCKRRATCRLFAGHISAFLQKRGATALLFARREATTRLS